MVNFQWTVNTCELQDIKLSRFCRKNIELSIFCWQDIEYSAFCWQDLVISTSWPYKWLTGQTRPLFVKKGKFWFCLKLWPSKLFCNKVFKDISFSWAKLFRLFHRETGINGWICTSLYGEAVRFHSLFEPLKTHQFI